MALNDSPKTDVLQSHEHQKLTSEQIAKAVARHNKAHPKGGLDAAAKMAKAEQKKASKR
jgi:hypothetical protein